MEIVWLKPDDLDGARWSWSGWPPRTPRRRARSCARSLAVWASRDWEGFAALLAPDFRQIDRRAFGGGALTRETFLESFRAMFHDGWTMERDALDAAGDRVLLQRMRFTGNSGASGVSEVEVLVVDELDEDGRVRTEVVFDPDDIEGARAEFDRMAAELGAPVPFENTATRARGTVRPRLGHARLGSDRRDRTPPTTT